MPLVCHVYTALFVIASPTVAVKRNQKQHRKSVLFAGFRQQLRIILDMGSTKMRSKLRKNVGNVTDYLRKNFVLILSKNTETSKLPLSPHKESYLSGWVTKAWGPLTFWACHLPLWKMLSRLEFSWYYRNYSNGERDDIDDRLSNKRSVSSSRIHPHILRKERLQSLGRQILNFSHTRLTPPPMNSDGHMQVLKRILVTSIARDLLCSRHWLTCFGYIN